MIKTLLKRTMITIVSISIVVIFVGVTFINVSPQFGGTALEESLKRIQNSPNFLNGTFQNLQKTVQSTDFKWSTIPNFFTDGNNKTPESELPSETIEKLFFNDKSKQPRITWFRHSAVLLKWKIRIFLLILC